MVIYTDGSSRGNPGPGGWGAVAIDDDGKFLWAYGRQYERNVTNNAMELEAIIWAYEMHSSATIYSDSSYSVNTLTNWVFGWKSNGWIKSDKKVPKNLDLLKVYCNLFDMIGKIDLRHCKGHADNQWNNLADAIATGKMTPEAVNEQYKQ